MSIPILETITPAFPGSPCKGAGRHRSRHLVTAAPAGVYVYESDANLCDVPSTALHITRGRGGFLRYAPDRAPNTNGLHWAAGDQTTYLKKGPMTVLTEEAVSDGDPVYVRHTANGAGKLQLGACRNDADGDAAEALRLTNALTTDSIEIDVVIDGILFSVATGSSETAAAKAILIAAAIDAHASYVAAQVGSTAEISITKATPDGYAPVATVLQTGVTETSGEFCARLPGAFFVGDAASGVATIDFDLP